MLPHSAPRMLPPRPLDQHQVQGPPMPPPPLAPSSGGRRKLPNIPRAAKLPHRPHVPHEPHYPSSFHSSFDEDMAPPMGSNLPPTVYESYHQQYRQLQRQQSSPMGSNRQLPMAPFGHRRTASSGSFTQPDEMGKSESFWHFSWLFNDSPKPDLRFAYRNHNQNPFQNFRTHVAQCLKFTKNVAL